jgi:hypothetical protein
MVHRLVLWLPVEANVTVRDVTVFPFRVSVTVTFSRCAALRSRRPVAFSETARLSLGALRLMLKAL